MIGPAPLCCFCVHFHKLDTFKFACDAYPEGIPQDIILWRKLHTAPLPGDHGIQYEAKPDAPPLDEIIP